MSKKPAVSIHARVLGGASITTGLGTIEPTAEILFAAALYLVLQRKEPVSRGTVQALLWPEASGRVAAHRMRQTLLKLRQLGVPIELRGKGHIGLNGTPVSVDYEEFLKTRTIGNAGNDALVMLPGYEPRFSQPYLEWLDAQKAEVNASLTRVMLGIIARHRVKGEWVEAERNAACLLRFQPYNEEATLAMAEACAMRGGKLQAMAILDRYLSEVGTGPTDLRLPATIMRRRIADRMHPRVESIAGQSPLVGRGAEMQQLAELLDRCRRKKGQACLVWGDAGVGKSRLLAEFSTFASLQGIPTQRVQCRPSDPHRPLSVFVDLVPGLRTMRGAIGCSPETFSYLDRLTKHKPTTVDVTSNDSDSEFIYAKVQQALFDLIDAVSEEGCLIVLVEDVHWVDSTSAKLLREMVAWAAEHSILFAFTGRDAPEGWLSGLANSLTDIRLASLEPGPSKDVVLGVVRQQGREIDEKYLDWCARVAEGNPYFLQELANQWVETGEQYTIPPSLTAILNDRVSRLSLPSLQLLQTCAILENHSSLERMEKVLGYEPHQLLRSIDELGAAAMLIVDPNQSDPSTPNLISPRHDLLSRVSLARLAPAALAFLHRRAGIVLEREIEKNHPASVLWHCANHWHASGNPARALKLGISCASHMMTIGLPESAADAFEKSLAYCSTDGDRLRVLEGLAHACESSSAWIRLCKVVPIARSIKQRIHPLATQHDELELMGIRAHWLTWELDVPIEQALQCLNEESATANHRVQAGVMALMLLDASCRQDHMPAVYEKIQSLVNNPEVEVAAGIEATMVFHTIYGKMDAGVEAAHALIANERQRDNCGDLFRRLCNTSTTFRAAGFFDDASAVLKEALLLAEQHRLKVGACRAHSMLAHLELERGDLVQARSWYQAILNARVAEDLYARLDLASLGTRFYLIDRQPKLARKHFPRKLDDIIRDSVGQRRAYQLALYTAILLVREDEIPDRVLSALETTHLLSRRNLHQAFAAFVLYRSLQRAGFPERAEHLLEEYATKYRRERSPLPLHLLEGLPGAD